MGKSDKYYADLVKIIREQGAKNNPTTLLLGVMQSEKSVKIGDLLVEKNDIYIASELIAGYQQKITTPYIKSVEVSIANGNATVSTQTEENLELKSGLKKGDIVAVMKLDNIDPDHMDTYVILAKVVRA